MAERQNWKFNYTGQMVGDAAQAKRMHHESRLDYWKGEAEKAKSDLKENGVEVREYDEGISASNSTRGGGVQMIVDPEKQRRYQDCVEKVQRHLSMVSLYRSFENACLGNPTTMIPLTVDDIDFFALHGE